MVRRLLDTMLCLFVGVLLFVSSFAPSIATEMTHYETFIQDRHGHLISGYTELEWKDDASVSGRICVYEAANFAAWVTGDFFAGRDDNVPLGSIKVEGHRIGSDRVQVRLIPEASLPKRVRKIFPSKSLKLLATQEVGRIYLNPPLVFKDGWSTHPQESGPYEESHEFKITLGRIPDSLPSVKPDEIVILSSPNGVEREFDLTTVGKMTPEQALSIFARSPPAEPIVPGFLWLVYQPKKRSEIAKFLERFQGASLYSTPQSDCGAPYVQDGIQVPPMLEFYIAYHLQISGLVEHADADYSPLDPGITAVHISGSPVASLLEDTTIAISDKSYKLASIFDDAVRAFVKIKRPAFKGNWEFRAPSSGSPLIYRTEIVGPSISRCQKNGWEKFVLQMMPTTYSDDGTPSLLVNVIEGYRAPGSLDKRPPDARFDHPLTDDQMRAIQDDLISFLNKRGFGNVSKEADLSIACPL
ncbi:hypothetical protein G7039_21660 [Rhizobium leguminosarum]|nr:hypothetical protein G7039_21660 [Rhizobium leguminosarum]